MSIPTCHRRRALSAAGPGTALVALVLIVAAAEAADERNRADVEFFETRIRPTLVTRCYKCHSEKSDDPGGGFLLDTRENIRRGGESGAAVVPGNVEDGTLLEALRYETFEMPPDEQLPEDVIADFEVWIERGAIDPRVTSNAQTPDLPTEGSAAEHWSFQPITDPPVPQVQQEDWPLTDVDRFALARMQQAGVSPVEDADRITWLRRVSLDLIGLPPSKQEVEAFLNDTGPDAYRAVVDRLLDSPEFGVRWGRHWLDVVRYAESTGFERNFTLPHAWRFRDYVIDSFNSDKPFDRFISEQLAGDLLSVGSEQTSDDAIIGTGMLALGPKNLLQGGSADDFALSMADDQINVTCRGILGLTVACARCHDHKFDPIPTEDYYALAGVFLSTETMYGTNPGKGGGSNRFPSELMPIGRDAAERHAEYTAYRERYDKQVLEVGNAESRLKKIHDQKKDLADEKSAEEIAAEEDVSVQKKMLAELKAAEPERPQYVMAARERDEPQDTAVRLSGISSKTGDVVPRGFLSVLRQIDSEEIPAESSGRLQLAHWLTSEQNPLTARVMANRIWHHLFGRGIVETVDNFGYNGTRPSHPELLDHLAVQFRQHGWSVKSLIREITLSRLYRLDSRIDEANAAVDGENILLWRMSPRRADAEVIRDCMLHASGELQCGAPEYGSLVAKLGDGCLVRQVNPDALQEHQPYRSAYLPMARHFAPTVHQVFDGPAASLVVGRRSVTNVPAQSLFLLNNDLVAGRSHAMARRLLAEQSADSGLRDGVERAYWLTLSRPPTSVEADHAIEFLHEAMDGAFVEDDENIQLTAWTAFCQALFLLGEFRTVY